MRIDVSSGPDRAGQEDELLHQPGSEHHVARRRRDPAARLRRLPGAARRDHRGRHAGAARRLPPPRHRRGLSQRGRRRAGRPRGGPRPRRGLHHDQVLQRPPRLRPGPARAEGQPPSPRDGARRPLPHPLARALAGPLRRDVAGTDRGAEAGPHAGHRGVELPARPPRAHHRARPGSRPAVNQVELHPRLQQPGLRREHADRGIVTEAWSPLAQGRGPRRPGDRGDRRGARARRRRRSSSAGTCSSATSSSPSR